MHGRFKFMTKEAKKLKEDIKLVVISAMAHCYDLGKIRENVRLEVTIEIYEDWLTKKGEVKIKDLANREKFLIDSIFEALGVDDKFIFKHTMSKIQSNEEKAVVTIEVLE
jgi:Holliday junction resolvase RusA-like endonuclease